MVQADSTSPAAMMRDAQQPPAAVQQVGDQPQVQEVRLGRLLGGVLLEHQADSDQQRGDQPERDSHGTAPGRTAPSLVTLAPRPDPSVAMS